MKVTELKPLNLWNFKENIMAKNYIKLFQEYEKEYYKLKAKYGLTEKDTKAKLSFEMFKDGFNQYASDLRVKKEYKTASNKDIALDMARNTVYPYTKESAIRLKKYAKEKFDKDISVADLRINKNDITKDLLSEWWKEKSEQGMSGEEWKLWSATYIFGSE